MAHVVNTEIIQRLGNLNLLFGVKKSIGELLTLSQRALDNLESRDVAKKVAHGLVGVRSMDVGVQLGLEAGVSRMSCN
jgi:hypothetical protein